MFRSRRMINHDYLPKHALAAVIHPIYPSMFLDGVVSTENGKHGRRWKMKLARMEESRKNFRECRPRDRFLLVTQSNNEKFIMVSKVSVAAC